MANSSKLPTGNDLKSSVILSFLVHHDWDDIPTPSKHVWKQFVGDQPAIINLKVESKCFQLYLPDRKNESKWTYTDEEVVYADLANASGTFFFRGEALPEGDEYECFLRQYGPKEQGLPIGRTVIEFHKDNILVGVFKTAVDNFGGQGERVYQKRQLK